VISSSECDVVLFVVLCGVVWFRVLLRCCLISCLVAVFVCSYWKINFSQSITKSINGTSTLQIQKHGYSGDLDLIILFVGILLWYAINLDVVSMFVVSSFTFLEILMILLYLMYSINLNEWISFCFCQKKKRDRKWWHKIFGVSKFMNLFIGVNRGIWKFYRY